MGIESASGSQTTDKVTAGRGETRAKAHDRSRNGDSRARPLSIESATAARFRPPAMPTYSIAGSICSAASLLVMVSVSFVMLKQLLDPQNPIVGGNGGLLGFLRAPAAGSSLAAWVWLPFLFTVFGAGLGFLFEAGLLLVGAPFRKSLNRFTDFVQRVRFLNLAPVTATILVFVASMVIADPSLRLAILFAAGAAAFGLGAGLFFGGAEAAVAATLLGVQVVQFLLVLTLGAMVGGRDVALLLMAQAALQLTALLIGTATPWKSTAFHLISTASGVLLYRAISDVTAVDGGFSHRVAVQLPPGSLARWAFFAVCILGLLLMLRAFPRTSNNWRSMVSNAIWSVLYFVLVSAKRFPNPINLSKVYLKHKPTGTKLKPYYQLHPEYLPEALSIPAAEELEGNVTTFAPLLNQVKKTFALIARLDHVLPQADSNVPLVDKPRMNLWSDGSDIYPRIFLKKLFGLTIPGPELETTPKPAIEAYKRGQLLAYLAESGVANPFLKPAEGRGPGALVVDFRFLERYETKPDYEPYGGVAYFRVDDEARRLELVSVVAPRTREEIAADPDDATFRHAEAQIIASLYYEVISGKHLAEIHMTYNLVEVALHDAFDVPGKYNHPFRTFMYLHLFSHELAEELTTEHLVQEGAVFTQIFATTHDSLIHHLNDSYHAFQYGEDEDFESRAAMMTTKDGETLPNACIRWELAYAEIFQRYTTTLIDIIYDNDAAVTADECLQTFHDALRQVMVNGLPARYDAFKTKAGVARFASDTISHLVIRHQVYGTTAVKAAMDPRISVTQVPRDGGTCGVDEWRSLICVALATARARFTLLMGDFTYLLDGVDERYKAPMHQAFVQLQGDLRALDEEWTATEAEKTFNYDYFRAVPSELHTGPGY